MYTVLGDRCVNPYGNLWISNVETHHVPFRQFRQRTCPEKTDLSRLQKNGPIPTHKCVFYNWWSVMSHCLIDKRTRPLVVYYQSIKREVQIKSIYECRESRKFQKRPPIGREGVYDENSDYRGKKTNRMEKKHKVYWLLLSHISSDSCRKHAIL